MWILIPLCWSHPTDCWSHPTDCLFQKEKLSCSKLALSSIRLKTSFSLKALFSFIRSLPRQRCESWFLLSRIRHPTDCLFQQEKSSCPKIASFSILLKTSFSLKALFACSRSPLRQRCESWFLVSRISIYSEVILQIVFSSRRGHSAAIFFRGRCNPAEVFKMYWSPAS